MRKRTKKILKWTSLFGIVFGILIWGGLTGWKFFAPAPTTTTESWALNTIDGDRGVAISKSDLNYTALRLPAGKADKYANYETIEAGADISNLLESDLTAVGDRFFVIVYGNNSARPWLKLNNHTYEIFRGKNNTLKLYGTPSSTFFLLYNNTGNVTAHVAGLTKEYADADSQAIGNFSIFAAINASDRGYASWHSHRSVTQETTTRLKLYIVTNKTDVARDFLSLQANTAWYQLDNLNSTTTCYAIDELGLYGPQQADFVWKSTATDVEIDNIRLVWGPNEEGLTIPLCSLN